MKRTTVVYLVALIALSMSFAACAKKEQPAASADPSMTRPTIPPMNAQGGARVERVTTAKSVNPDDSPGEAAAAFAKGDTVYVSLWTANAPVGTELRARWIGTDGKQFNEDRIVTDTAGDGYTSFYARNRNGWAVGNYRVEILLNGQPAASVAFVVS